MLPPDLPLSAPTGTGVVASNPQSLLDMTREKVCVVVDHGKYTSVLWGGNLKTDPEKFPFTWFAWLYRPGAEKALFYTTGNDRHNTERRMIQAISAQNQIEALQMKETTCGTTC